MHFVKKHIDKIIIILFVFLLYGNTINNHYSIDDKYINSNNRHIAKGISGIQEILTSYYDESYNFHYGYRPITQIFFAVEYSLFHDNPYISHLINIILYCITLILLYRILSKNIFNKTSKYLSLLVVLLFTAHPLHTEVIASLKNREELLSFLFGIITINLFLKYLKNNKTIYLIYAVLVYLIGNFTKESFVVFTLLIPLTLFYFAELKGKRFFILTGSLIFIVFLIRWLKSYFFHPDVELLYFENPLHFDSDIFTRLGTGLMVMLYYLKLMLFPHPLLFYYGYDMVPIITIFDYRAIISLLLHLILFYISLKFYKKNKQLSFAILFYLVSILFISNIPFTINGIVGERLAFVASLGYTMMIGMILWQIKERKHVSYIFYVVIGIIFTFFTYKTIDRNNDWDTEKSLFEADIKYLENSAKANGLYATSILNELAIDPDALNKKDKIEKALKHFQKSVQISPDYYSSYTNIGYIYLMFYNDINGALKYFDLSLNAKKENTAALFYKGLCYERKSNYQEAVKYYSEVLKYNPDDIQALSKMANWSFKQGDYNKSIEYNGKIIKQQPELDIPFINVGNYFFMSGDTINALKYWEMAYDRNQGNYYMLLNLVNLYKAVGNLSKYEFYDAKLMEFKMNETDKKK